MIGMAGVEGIPLGQPCSAVAAAQCREGEE